jgi:hypothetical protein
VSNIPLGPELIPTEKEIETTHQAILRPRDHVEARAREHGTLDSPAQQHKRLVSPLVDPYD